MIEREPPSDPNPFGYSEQPINLGHLRITPKALEVLVEAEEDIVPTLYSHYAGPPHDQLGDEVVSRFIGVDGQIIWVVTEVSKQQTLIMLSTEYYPGKEQGNQPPLDDESIIHMLMEQKEEPPFPEWTGEYEESDHEIPKSLFEGGRVMATPAALNAIKDAELEPMDVLARHLVGDWGDVSEEEKMLNDQAVICGEEILSAYRLPSGVEIWVITESNREVTRLKLSDEEDEGNN